MNETPSLHELMGKIGDLFSYEELCKLSPENIAEYSRLLNHLIQVNGSSASTTEKGRALEDLVAYLLQISGNIFEIVKNVRTNSNEIDEVVCVNTKGRALIANGLLPTRLSFFLGECKNYKHPLSVTYVGKFYSLLQTTNIETGILFTCNGVSGQKWNYASGLIKKIYMQKEDETKRIAIIEFTLNDFKAILKGHNLFELLDKKLCALRLDTSIDSFISTHPAESQFKN